MSSHCARLTAGCCCQLLYINVLWPVGVQFLTVLMVGGYIAWKRYVDGDDRYGWRFFLPGSAIASGSGAVAMWKFSGFSLFDQLNATLTSLPSPFIDTTSQNVLNVRPGRCFCRNEGCCVCLEHGDCVDVAGVSMVPSDQILTSQLAT